MSVKSFAKRILNVNNYDREAERLIYKSIDIYHRGGKINRLRARRLYNKIREKYCCNIWPGITVGEGMYIAHAHAICIGRTTVIGKNCRIYPHSDIVAGVVHDRELIETHTRRHALIGDDCIIGNGAMIIGAITIGDDVTIGAGAMVTKDVPSHTVVKNVNEFRPKRDDEIPEHYKTGSI